MKLGQVVRLKSGGVSMSVNGIDMQNNGNLICVWHDEYGNPLKESYHQDTLIIVNNEKLDTDRKLYLDLLNELGCNGHSGAVAEIRGLREAAGLNKSEIYCQSDCDCEKPCSSKDD